MTDELGETLDIGPAIRQMAKEELAKLDAPERTPLSERMEDVWAESVADGDEHLCIAHDLWLELKGEVAALEQERVRLTDQQRDAITVAIGDAEADAEGYDERAARYTPTSESWNKYKRRASSARTRATVLHDLLRALTKPEGE